MGERRWKSNGIGIMIIFEIIVEIIMWVVVAVVIVAAVGALLLVKKRK